MVKRWTPDQVASFSFASRNFAGLIDSGTRMYTVRDRNAVASLLRGLQEAAQLDIGSHGYGYTGNEFMDDLRIDLKPRTGGPKSPILLHLNFSRPWFCYGPAFYRAVCGLSECQASQVRRFAKDNAGKVQSLEIDDERVTDPAEVTRLVRELETVNASAFVLGQDNLNGVGVVLHLKGGSEHTVIFIFPPESPARPVHPVLPPYLWMHYMKQLSS